MKQRPDKVCGIMLDTKGPEIRTGMLVDSKPITLTMGQDLIISTDYALEGDNTRMEPALARRLAERTRSDATVPEGALKGLYR